MTTATTSSTTSSNAAIAALQSTGSTSSSKSTLASSTPQETSDRFLKLLVAQMQNQDPLSPMDNAQVTSQMAQINTVSGINQLNDTMTGLTGQFAQLQAMQGASLVGHSVLIEGNKLDYDSASNSATAAFELSGAADAVKIEVLSPAGKVIDTVNAGAETSGKHSFTWTPSSTPSSTTGLTFRVSATSGASAVSATSLVEDTVQAISTTGSTVNVELKNNGTVAYSKVKTIS